MLNINATFISKDQNWADGTTTYWFNVNGDTYGVVHGGETWNAKVVDRDGCPTSDYSVDQFNITNQMIAE